MDLTAVALLLAGIAVLAVGGELLVRGSAQLATGAGIPPVVVGLTVVAFGTSAPELAVSLSSAFGGSPELALGNVVGSNISNVLLILGIGALMAPLVVAQRLVRVEVPVMCAAALALFALGLDGGIDRLDGVLLSVALVVFVAVTAHQARRESAAIRAEYAGEYGSRRATGRWWVRHATYVVVGLVTLVVGAAWLVDGASTIARGLGLSELVIGLTVVAVGTSAPELATTIMATVRGERDIAVGNIVGSNIFNILCVLGFTALVAPAGLPVPAAALRFDIPFMVAVCIACLPVFFQGYHIARWEGAVFLAYYVAYVLYLYLDTVQHEALPAFSAALFLFAVPLTAVTLTVIAFRQLLGERSRTGAG